MNVKINLIILFVIAILFSCEKRDNIDDHEKVLEDSIENKMLFFVVGQIDSAEYFDFIPDIEIGFLETNDSYFMEITDSIDFDLDGFKDIAIHRENNSDIDSYAQYYSESLINLSDYEFACDSAGFIIPFNQGDTLSNDLNWIVADDYLLWYCDGNNCEGLWNVESGADFFMAFRRIETDTVYGWLRREVISTGYILKFKDCGLSLTP